jgi:hypothetical protein
LRLAARAFLLGGFRLLALPLPPSLTDALRSFLNRAGIFLFAVKFLLTNVYISGKITLIIKQRRWAVIPLGALNFLRETLNNIFLRSEANILHPYIVNCQLEPAI